MHLLDYFAPTHRTPLKKVGTLSGASLELAGGCEEPVG